MGLLPRPSPRDRAAEWLLEALASGPVLATEIEERARNAGFAKNTLWRAKTELGITSFREGAGWMWRLLEQQAPAPEGAQGPHARAIGIGDLDRGGVVGVVEP